MSRSRSARQSLIAYRVSDFFRRWVGAGVSGRRSQTRETQAASVSLEALETRQMLVGTISGTVWHDVLEVVDTNPNDGVDVTVNPEDGIFQQPSLTDPNAPYEAGAAGVRIFVDADNNRAFDPGEIFSITDVNGNYELENVPDGLARVRIDLPEPGDVYTVDLNGTVTQYNGGAYLTAPPFRNNVVSQFDIEVVYSGVGFTPERQAVFDAAAARWAEIIIDDLPDVIGSDGSPIDDLRIDASILPIDGAGGTLGQATFTRTRTAAQGGMPSEGFMQFDDADIAALEASGTFEAVILHEMGHVLGFSQSFWRPNGLMDDTTDPNNPVFLGANAAREYSAIFGVTSTTTPIEEGGGPGTALSHWDEETFANELMTGFLSGLTQPISLVTVGALEDMGYGVNYAAADPYTPPIPITAPSLQAEPLIDGFFSIPEVEVGSSTALEFSSLVSPQGYDIIINDGDVVTDQLFGIAPIEDADTTVGRPPITVDQEFEVIEFSKDAPRNLYPDIGSQGVYIVGRVEAVDVDNPSDPDGRELFYKIVNGNLGDEFKAFDIVKDYSDTSVEELAAALGLDPVADRAIIDNRMITDLLPGTIYVQNEFLLQRNIRDINNRFELTILVADEDPDGVDANGDNRIDPDNPAEADADGDFGVIGEYQVSTVGISLVPYNRIGETPGNNDSIPSVIAAINSGDRSSIINEGDPDTHQRLNFNINPIQSYLDEFLDRNTLGDPTQNQFGATDDEWVYIEGEIEDRGNNPRDIDFYRIDITSPTGLFIDVDAEEELGSGLNAEVRVYNSSQGILPQTNFATTGQALSQSGYDFEYYRAPTANDVSDDRSKDPSLYVDLQPGTYYISVEGQVENGVRTTGAYQLKLIGDQQYTSTPEVDPVNNPGTFHNTIDIDNDGLPDNQELDVVTGVPGSGENQLVFYLDFDGEQNVVIPTPYGNGIDTADVGAFDFDGDPSQFTPGERMAIQNIFRIVREDYSPFNVNVTTDRAVYDAAVLNGDLTYHAIVTETLPFDFTGNAQTTNFRILEGAGLQGFVFARNVLTFSPGDTNPVSGRIVASAIETGNYTSNLLALAAGFVPYSGAGGATGSVFQDAIVGVADQGLNAEFWKRGTNTLRGTQYDLNGLHEVIGWRNGAAAGDFFNGILNDRDGQWNHFATGPLDGNGGRLGGNVNNLRFTQLPGVGFNDVRNITSRFELSGVISNVPAGSPWDPNPQINEGDFDTFRFQSSDESRIYVNVDEYSNNLDVRVQLFQVSNSNIVNVMDISLNEDANGNLTRVGDGATISAAEIARARRDGIRLTGNDAYIDLDDYGGGTIFIYVSTNDADNPASNVETRWQGNYTVTGIRQVTGNTQPDGPDQSVIILDEQPTEDRRPVGFVPYGDWFRVGQVDVGSGFVGFTEYFGDRQNPVDGGEFGQILQYSLRQVTGDSTTGSQIITDADEFLFLDSGTGEVYITDPSRLDFEAFSVYHLLIDIADNGDPARNASVTLDITVRDINELPVGVPLVIDTPENPAVGTVLGQIDVDDPDDQVFNYTIDSVTAYDASGNVVTTIPNATLLGLFSIDTAGQIVVNDPPEGPTQIPPYPEIPENPLYGFLDFEQYSRFEVAVTATEDRVTPNAPVIVDVTINLTDVNEQPNFAPGITNAPVIEVSENAPNGQFVFDFGYIPAAGSRTVGTENAAWRVDTLDRSTSSLGVYDDDNTPPTDPTTGPGGTETLTFSITDARVNGGSAGSATGVFGIDPTTGILTILNADAINFENAPTTAGPNGTLGQWFEVTVRVQDDGDPVNNRPPLVDTTVLRIGIMNESPEPPVLTDRTVQINENAPNGTVLTTAVATGEDLPAGSFQYSIVSAVAGPTNRDVTGLFVINPTTGQITVANSLGLSYESFLPDTTGQIRLTVQASIGTPALSDTAVFTVDVLDVVETNPSGPSPQAFSILENTVGAVGQVVATESDAGQSIVSFQIVAGDPGGVFSIDNSGNIRTVTPLDFETQRTYNLRVRFYDNDIPATFGEVDVVVSVLNVNEPPVLAPVVLSIEENSLNGVRVNVDPIRAVDPEGNAITYAIVSGNTDGAFEIRPAIGGGFNVFVANTLALDFERTPTFTLTIRMTDNGVPVATADTTVTINLIDIEEYADIAVRDEARGVWYLYNSTGTDFTRQQFGLWSASIDWANVMSGDFNGDGRTDLIGQDPSTGFWYVGLAQNSGQMATSRWGAAWSNPGNYVDHVVADFNGDGRDDIAGREAATGRWRVGLSTGSTLNSSNWVGGFDRTLTWSAVEAGDFTGDGLADIIGFDAFTGQGYIATSTGTAFTVTTWGQALGSIGSYDNFIVADFDGDGDDDLAFRDRTVTTTGGVWRYVVDGLAGPGTNELTNLPFSSSTSPGFDNTRQWRNVKAGDFDGNGRMDIVLQDAETKDWWVLISRANDANMRFYTSWADNFETGEVEVADFNGDGIDDIAARRLDEDSATPGTSRGWQVGLGQPTGAKGFLTSNWGRGIDPVNAATQFVDATAGQFNIPGKQPLNEDAESPLDLPFIQNARFEVGEGASNGVFIGRIEIDPGFSAGTTFRIASGNTGGAFALSRNGNGDLLLSVANGGVIDATTLASYHLIIEGTDPALPSPVTSTVIVDVLTAADGAFADVLSLSSSDRNWYAYRSNGWSFERAAIGTWPSVISFTEPMSGDFNNDGRTDVAAMNVTNGQWVVGLARVDGTLDIRSWGTPWGTGFTDLLVGDFNGDGRDDVTARSEATGRWRVGLSNGTTFSRSDWQSAWRTDVNWTAVQAGDFNGDGRTDIIGMDPATGQFLMARSTGTTFNFRSWGQPIGPASNFADFLVGDLDGDGDDDLAFRDLTVVGTAGAWRLVIDEVAGVGTNERTNLAGINNQREYRNAVIADFDGNGKDDIAIQDVHSKNWFVLISRNGDSNPRRYANWGDTLEHGPVVVGDFNGDGLADIAARRLDPRFDGSWQVGIAQPGGEGYPKQFLTSRWDVNDPLDPSVYVADLAGQNDVPGPQPTNHRAALPSNPAQASADSPVIVTAPAGDSVLRAATDEGTDPSGSTGTTTRLASSSLLANEDTDLLDDLAGSGDDLMSFLDSLS